MTGRFIGIFLTLCFLNLHITEISQAQSLDLSLKGYGISFGNSKNFNGLRLNLRDSQVEEINGLNFTLWRANENERATVRGISVGLSPEAGNLHGLMIGGLGVAADKQLEGISLGLLGVGAGRSVKGITIGGLGAGSGEDITGIAIGGLGAGAGRSIKGITIGGLGAGSGEDMTGITIGGLGAGAGRNLKGLTVGLLGAGAGHDIVGVTLGGLAAGAGGNITGLTLGLIGVGAGENVTGISIGGVGVGAGNKLKWINVGGVGVAAPMISGLTVAGFQARGEQIKGVTLALGWVKVEGNLSGFSASTFNQIKGKQTGVALGIVNVAYELNGVQIGLINYVRDNPRYRTVLPVINANF